MPRKGSSPTPPPAHTVPLQKPETLLPWRAPNDSPLAQGPFRSREMVGSAREDAIEGLLSYLMCLGGIREVPVPSRQLLGGGLTQTTVRAIRINPSEPQRPKASQGSHDLKRKTRASLTG